MQNLKPCPYRHVDDEGHILCEKIKMGDREVSPNICRACPVAAINCGHLRATLNHEPRSPITVRYGNGKTEIWEDDAPSISLGRAACAAKVIPILSPRDCAGCALRQALITPESIAMPPYAVTAQPLPSLISPAAQEQASPRQRRQARPVPNQLEPVIAAVQPLAPEPAMPPVAIASPPAAISSPVDSETEKRRSSIVAQKIIKLQEWLEKQKTAAPTRASDRPEPAVAGAVRRSIPPSRPEEKRVGWTD